MAYLPKVVTGVIVVVVAAAVAVKEIIQSTLGGLSYGKTVAVGASVAILVVGAFAAVSQLQIASAIGNGLLYALLTVVVARR